MPVAEYVNGEIHVETTWSHQILVKQIPGGRWEDDIKRWVFAASWVVCVQLRGVFGADLVIGPRLRAWAVDHKTAFVVPAMGLRSLTDTDAWHGSDKLYPFQRAGVKFLLHSGSALLADEMGTGKTIQTLETLRLAHQGVSSDSLPVLIVCPKSMKGTWRREAETWFPEAVPYVVEGSVTRRRQIFAKAAMDPCAMVIINFEGVRGHSRKAGFGSMALKSCKECVKIGYAGVKVSECETHPRELNQIPFLSVVVDEAHRLKDPKAIQTRAVWAVGQGASVKRRLALTGTPLASNPGDLWALLHFIAPREFPRKTAFVTRYCQTSFNAYGGLEVAGIRPDTREEFFAVLDPRFRRMPKALVLHQLPPKVRVKRFVQLDAKQRKAYDQLDATLVTRLEDGSLLIPRAHLSAQVRLLQFSSAYMERGPDKKVTKKDEAGQTVTEWVETWLMKENSPKLDAMEEILEEMGDKQVAVCAASRQLIEMAEVRLRKAGITYGTITGKTPQWDREAQLRDFQAGKLRVMLFTIQAGGVGLTMTAADTIIFLQRSWSMVENRQTEDRVHRIGSEKHASVTVIDLIAEDTVEETQINRLWIKDERLEEITRDRVTLAAAGLSTAHLDALEEHILNTDLGVPA